MRNGFGKALETIQYEGKLFHSCTIAGLDFMMNNFATNDSDFCSFSTENATRLFGRNCVIVMKAQKREFLYTPYDADAGIDFGWDEARPVFESQDQFLNEIEAIIMSQDTYDTLTAAENMTDGELAESENAEFYYDLFENIAPQIEIAEESGYTAEFLNF